MHVAWFFIGICMFYHIIILLLLHEILFSTLYSYRVCKNSWGKSQEFIKFLWSTMTSFSSSYNWQYLTFFENGFHGDFAHTYRIKFLCGILSQFDKDAGQHEASWAITISNYNNLLAHPFYRYIASLYIIL